MEGSPVPATAVSQRAEQFRFGDAAADAGRTYTLNSEMETWSDRAEQRASNASRAQRREHCQRVGCTGTAEFAVRFDVEHQRMLIESNSEGLAVARFCGTHAAAVRPPRGWIRVDGSELSLVASDSASRLGRKPECAVMTEAEKPMVKPPRPNAPGPLLARALAHTEHAAPGVNELFGLQRAVG